MSIHQWNMESHIKSECLELFKASKENKHQNQSSKKTAEQKSDQILFKKETLGHLGQAIQVVKFFSSKIWRSPTALERLKGSPINHPKKVANAELPGRMMFLFPLFHTRTWLEGNFFVGKIPLCCVRKQELHGLFEEKEMLGVINLWKKP